MFVISEIADLIDSRKSKKIINFPIGKWIHFFKRSMLHETTKFFVNKSKLPDHNYCFLVGKKKWDFSTFSLQFFSTEDNFIEK